MCTTGCTMLVELAGTMSWAGAGRGRCVCSARTQNSQRFHLHQHCGVKRDVFSPSALSFEPRLPPRREKSGAGATLKLLGLD